MNKLVENINDITIKFSEYQTTENVKKNVHCSQFNYNCLTWIQNN